MQPNITPNSNNQVIEPGGVVNVQGIQAVNANPQQQVPDNQQSAVGRNSPYTLANQNLQQQIQPQQQQPLQPLQQQVEGQTQANQEELSTQFVVDDSGTLQQVNPVQVPNQQQSNQQIPQQPQVQQPNINQFVQQPPNNAPDNTAQMTNLMQQNQLLQNAILEMKSGNGNGNVTQQQTQAPKTLPKIGDFTKDLGDDWNPDDALKPSTKSGVAYANWMDARDSHRDEQYQNQVVNLITEREQSSRSLQKAEEFANKNPHFKDQLTGKADINKIKAFLENAVDGDWNILFNALNVRQNPQMLTNQPQQLVNQPAQHYQPQQQLQPPVQQPMVLPNNINAAANNISPIANVGGGSAIQNQAVNVPDSVKILQSTYGNNFQLPPGAQIDNTKYYNTK